MIKPKDQVNQIITSPQLGNQMSYTSNIMKHAWLFIFLYTHSYDGMEGMAF